MEHRIAAIIQKHDIILFDAICVICNGWAKFLIKHDQKLKFKLVSAQSALGEQILQYYGMSTEYYTTMLVVIFADECGLSHPSSNPRFSIPLCGT